MFKDLTFIETSAQNGDNINLAFDNIISGNFLNFLYKFRNF